MGPKKKLYEVNLEKIKGSGDFLCPRCGTRISPDDDSNKIYEIIDVRTEDGELERVIIVCKNCSSRIDITGFISGTQPKRKAKKEYQKYDLSTRRRVS